MTRSVGTRALRCDRLHRPATRALVPLSFVMGCSAPPAPATLSARGDAPALTDCGSLCLDVGARRACWGESDSSCGARARWVPRTLPNGPAPERGYRCEGSGEQRRCVDRAALSDPFDCDESGCTQSHPELPSSDAEWECVETSSVVQCRRFSDAAGVPSPRGETAFACGPRRGAPHQVICVDFSPETPPLEYACRVRFEGAQPTRVCGPSGMTQVASECPDVSACPPGSECVDGYCLPHRPKPDCWLDTDCDADQRCRFGTCETNS